jgi:primary-amine oxidase
LTLREPPKNLVLRGEPKQDIERQAFAVLLDNATGTTSEVVVSLTASAITSWTPRPGVQPGIMLDEFFEVEQALKRDPAFQQALRKRGVTDFDLVMVDPWAAGNYGAKTENQRRVMRALTWVRSEPNDNGYARPVEGVMALVDLNKMELVEIEDTGVVPFPPDAGNYSRRYVQEFRRDLKPLRITQPEGPSFDVKGHEVSWQKWNMRVGFTQREGLVLHTISYEDNGRRRPVIYRASLSEMVVPYGDPRPNNYRKNAFDVGEYGIGMLANALELGCDCLGEIYYFDAHITNSKGEVVKLPNVICMHEEDYGIGWKHTDWRTNEVEVRRSRRLVLSFIATVGNYEYGFFWYFYQDGTIQFEVKLTGIINTCSAFPDDKSKYGTLVARQLYAPNHQHFFNVRLDMMVDGANNSVFKVDTVADPPGPSNPHGNAFYAKADLLDNERNAADLIDPLAGRYWKIVNSSSLNELGEPVAYKLMPGDNVRAFAHESASISQRAGFIRNHVWVTAYDPGETFAAGDYPNQHPGGDGLPRYVQQGRSIENTNVVVWYTLGCHHLPRPEDWPVMPAAYIGFHLKPSGFFKCNPALDVPPPERHSCC